MVLWFYWVFLFFFFLIYCERKGRLTSAETPAWCVTACGACLLAKRKLKDKGDIPRAFWV